MIHFKSIFFSKEYEGGVRAIDRVGEYIKRIAKYIPEAEGFRILRKNGEFSEYRFLEATSEQITAEAEGRIGNTAFWNLTLGMPRWETNRLLTLTNHRATLAGDISNCREDKEYLEHWECDLVFSSNLRGVSSMFDDEANLERLFCDTIEVWHPDEVSVYSEGSDVRDLYWALRDQNNESYFLPWFYWRRWFRDDQPRQWQDRGQTVGRPATIESCWGGKLMLWPHFAPATILKLSVADLIGRRLPGSVFRNPEEWREAYERLKSQWPE